MLAKVKKSYRGTKQELSRVVGGIWAKQTDKVRAEIVKKYEKNPGAAWHEKEWQKADDNVRAHTGWKKDYYTGRRSAQSDSIDASDKRGLPNPIIGLCPKHGNQIKASPGAKSVRCPHGHTLNIPKR